MPNSEPWQVTPKALEPAQSAAPKGNVPSEVAGSAIHEGEVKFHMPQMVDLQSADLMWSSRTVIPTDRAMESSDPEVKKIFSITCMLKAAVECLSSLPQISNSVLECGIYHTEITNTLYDKILNDMHPMAFAANQQQNEIYTFKDMMIQDDAKDVIAAMLKEVEVYKNRNHWTCMLKSDVPKVKLDKNGKLKTILSIWSFKRKRFSSGKLMEHKARLCAHGGMQQWGLDFWENFSPVVMWIIVRTLFTIVSIHSLPTKCIDFVLAFSQPDLDVDVFMELPVGMT
eukprot:1760911-Ditylum_brightwellii.AAC.1